MNPGNHPELTYAGEPQTINSVDPGVLGKTATFHDLDDGEQGNDAGKVQVTVENDNGDRESIVLLRGDVRLAMAFSEGDAGKPARDERNDQLDADNPGFGEGDPVPDDSPATTDPEGDAGKDNAPEAPAPVPAAVDVATNPGTDPAGSQATPEGTPPGFPPEGTPPAE